MNTRVHRTAVVLISAFIPGAARDLWPVFRWVAVTCLVASQALAAQAAGGITGAGSSFFDPLVQKWAASYYGKTGQQVSFHPIGSGNGIDQLKAAKVDFGASDMPLKPDELRAFGLIQFPVAAGGLVPVVNLDGIGAGQLHLTGALLADIYLGKITDWNDAAIKAVNPGLALPDLKIVVVHRGDRSGSTFNWTNYLCAASAQWREQVGSGLTVKWPVGISATSSQLAATYVKRIKGAIAYVELTYAGPAPFAYASVQNKSGAFVEPSAASFKAAVETVAWGREGDFYQLVTDPPGDHAWPIPGVVFILMRADSRDKAGTNAVLALFRWALTEGRGDAATENYGTPPPNLVGEIEAYWAQNLTNGHIIGVGAIGSPKSQTGMVHETSSLPTGF
ncbi:phosphate ABC transporter substrate-binding protein (PhoT family) [Paraburkholderia sp. BL23I1N1]|uniref:phosphate ABC transporter substrate-binding protein PstS n=1 Tax=Paraburkholderia sp. BL23I1N1 TaxID=1938802 RepID=UPI000E76D430|nr:phosphate ABC transporter substrate-binding protein PstS [Paraburkholderia sp. BL23I1N1]RKE40098.1 phosphate ABC transporter substrate-binding protein (PhoT family) [Paraburkholderia sp. BL23I1N1]